MGDTIKIIKICTTVAERQDGLQNTVIAEDEACVFIFESPKLLKFWGKNTPQDLYVLGVNNGIVEEKLMIQAWNTTPVISLNRYPMAIESRLDIPVGSRIEFDGKVAKVI